MRTGSLITVALALAVGGCHDGSAGGGDLSAVDVSDLGDVDLGGLAGGDPADLAPAGSLDLGGTAPPDMTPPTLMPSNIRLYGGTTVDGWAAVVDQLGTAWALKLADGTARRIADHQQDTWASGDVLWFWHGSGGSVQSVELWHGDGPAVHLADDGVEGTPSALSDGAGHVAYLTYVGTNGNTDFGKLWLDSVDHSSARVVNSLLSDIFFPGTCNARMQFFAGRLLVQHCAYPATTRTVLSSYDVSGTDDVDLATDALNFAVVKDVGVLVTSTSGALNLVAADGSGTLTSTPLLTDARKATVTADGSAAIVITKTGALERVDLGSHAVTVLQSSGATFIQFVANDGASVTYTKNFDTDTDLYDVWMSDARTTGTTAVGLVPTSTSLPMTYGFTTNSAFALYLADVDATRATFFGSLRAFPVAGGSERVLAAGSDQVKPVGGSRILFGENLSGTWPDMRADISFVDLAAGDAPTKLATQVYWLFDVLADGVTLVYLEPGVGMRTVKLP